LLPKDELIPTEDDEEKTPEKDEGRTKKKDEKSDELTAPIVIKGLPNRLYEVPLSGKNFGQLKVSDDYLYWTESEISKPNKKLYALKISNQTKNKPTLVAEDIN
jgi:hypothetical protein